MSQELDVDSKRSGQMGSQAEMETSRLMQDSDTKRRGTGWVPFEPRDR